VFAKEIPPIHLCHYVGSYTSKFYLPMAASGRRGDEIPDLSFVLDSASKIEDAM
jgi:hypothetical protein